MTRQMLKGIRVKSKEENEEPVVYHWKYKLEEVNPNEGVTVDTLPIKKSS